MAVVVYQCDTCKRDVELIRNIYGMETIQRCTITQGCRGKLYQTKLLEDYVNTTLPEPVIGLDDWHQRKVLVNHQQTIERDKWTIEYDVYTAPTVSVYVNRQVEDDLENLVEIIPEDVDYSSPGFVILTFDRPWAGFAQLIATESNPILENRIISTDNINVIDSIQLTNQGEISIATLMNSPVSGEPNNPDSISLQFTFNTETTELSTPYSADNQPSLLSPWFNYNTVVINGQLYTVRSFNTIIPEMANGDINNGSSFIVNAISRDNTFTNFRPVEKHEVLILLATHPYEIFDKITNKYIDVTSATFDNFALFYNTGELFSLTSIMSDVYPYIRSV